MNLSTLLLSRETVATLATSRDFLAAAKIAFSDVARGRYGVSNVLSLHVEGGAFHVKACTRDGDPPLAVVKVNGNFPGNERLHALPTIQGFIALLDARNGSVLALMDSIEITARRTAAATALAAQHLARAQSRVLAIIGCGVQARYHLDALLDVIAVAELRCHDVRADAAAELARYASSLGVHATVTDSAVSAARAADLIVTLTTSTTPVLTLADVAPGAFVAGVGADNPAKHELAPDLMRASRVVVDSLQQTSTIGDLQHAIRAGSMSVDEVHAELADIVSGARPGRVSDAERIVFDSTGMAAQDLAAAEMIWRRALRDGPRAQAFSDGSRAG